MTPNNFENTTDSNEQIDRNILLSGYIEKIYDLIDKIVSIWNRNLENMNDEDSEYEQEYPCRFGLTIGDNTDIYYLDEGIDDIYNIDDIDDLKKKIKFIITQQKTTGDYNNIPIYLHSIDMFDTCKEALVINQQSNPLIPLNP